MLFTNLKFGTRIENIFLLYYNIIYKKAKILIVHYIYNLRQCNNNKTQYLQESYLT
jgi:hypothetical protein